jgi:hypothetical protein
MYMLLSMRVCGCKTISMCMPLRLYACILCMRVCVCETIAMCIHLRLYARKYALLTL